MEQQPDCDFKVGGYEDAAHLKSCSLGASKQKCARCKWATYKVKWQKDLPWLDAKMNLDSGLWGIGCRLCHDAQQVAPEVMSKFPVSRHHFARYEVSTGEIRVTRFRKHAESPAHRTAESMAGGKEPALDDIGGFTPSTAEWKSVINHTKPSNYAASRCERCCQQEESPYDALVFGRSASRTSARGCQECSLSVSFPVSWPAKSLSRPKAKVALAFTNVDAGCGITQIFAAS